MYRPWMSASSWRHPAPCDNAFKVWGACCDDIEVQVVKRKHRAFTFSMRPIPWKKTSTPSLIGTKRLAWTATNFMSGTWKQNRNAGMVLLACRSQPTSRLFPTRSTQAADIRGSTRVQN